MIPQIIAVQTVGVLSVAGFTGNATFAYVPGLTDEKPRELPGRAVGPDEQWGIVHAAPPWDLVKDRWRANKGLAADDEGIGGMAHARRVRDRARRERA